MSSSGGLCTVGAAFQFLGLFFVSPLLKSYSEVLMKRGPNWEKSVQWPSSLRLQGKQILFPECAPGLEARLTGLRRRLGGTGLSDSAHRAQEALGGTGLSDSAHRCVCSAQPGRRLCRPDGRLCPSTS